MIINLVVYRLMFDLISRSFRQNFNFNNACYVDTAQAWHFFDINSTVLHLILLVWGEDLWLYTRQPS